MTNKQIIIDGCDVSGCRYAEPTATTPKCAINNWIHCDGHNCYYKQRKRAENQIVRLNKKVEAKEQECEELKQKLHQCWNVEYSFVQQLDQLKAENGELKKQLMQKSEVDMFFNTPIEGWSNDPCDICKYKNCITEIKKFVENEMTQNSDTYIILQKISEVLK